MKITLDTETMEIKAQPHDKKESDLIMQGSVPNDRLTEEERKTLIKLQNATERLLLSAVCGTAKLFFRSDEGQDSFVQAVTEDLLKQLIMIATD